MGGDRPGHGAAAQGFERVHPHRPVLLARAGLHEAVHGVLPARWRDGDVVQVLGEEVELRLAEVGDPPAQRAPDGAPPPRGAHEPHDRLRREVGAPQGVDEAEGGRPVRRRRDARARGGRQGSEADGRRQDELRHVRRRRRRRRLPAVVDAHGVPPDEVPAERVPDQPKGLAGFEQAAVAQHPIERIEEEVDRARRGEFGVAERVAPRRPRAVGKQGPDGALPARRTRRASHAQPVDQNDAPDLPAVEEVVHVPVEERQAGPEAVRHDDRGERRRATTGGSPEFDEVESSSAIILMTSRRWLEEGVPHELGQEAAFGFEEELMIARRPPPSDETGHDATKEGRKWSLTRTMLGRGGG